MNAKSVWNPSRAGRPSTEVAQLAESHRFSAVLDVGCGWGRNMVPFASTASELHGFDLDREGVSQAKALLAESPARIKLWHADVRKVHLRGAYDLVICYGVTHFFTPQERAHAYNSLEEWVAPGGILAISSFNSSTPIPMDLRPLMPEPPASSAELIGRFSHWESVFSRSHTYQDEHEGGIKHTHSIDRLIVRRYR